MLPGVKIRPATEADLAGIGAVAAAVCKAPEVAAFWAARYGSAALVVDRCRACLSWVLIAEHRGEVVGFAAWRQDEMVGVVGTHAVHPERQGWGVGAALLSALVEGLRAEGIRLLEATLPESFQEARRLYEARGFREIARSAQREVVWVRYEKRFRAMT